MDVKESSPVLPDPGKIEPMKVPEQNQTVPLYPENSKVGQAAKTAGILEKKQP